MTDWSALETAYGTAEGVPGLLAAAATGGDAAWNDVWSHLCHQGTVYTASFAALPELARLAEEAPPASFSQPLYLAAMIVASDDRSDEAEDVDVRRDYAAELSRMSALAERNLALATDLQDVAYAAHCVAALEGIPVWADELDRLGNGETDVECPSCDEGFVADLDEATPVDPSELDEGSARVHRLLAGHSDAAAAFLRFAGTVACPRCGTRFSVPAALT